MVVAAGKTSNSVVVDGTRRILIRNVSVIDGSGAPMIGPTDVVIEGGVIARVSTLTQAQLEVEQQNSDVIDGTGLYLTPGLVDTHMHIHDSEGAPRNQYWYPLLFASGVTTTRTFDVGAMHPQEMVEERARVEEATLATPKLQVFPIWGENPDPEAEEAYADAQQTVTIVDRWADAGVDGIKIREYPGMAPEIFHQIAKQCKARGIGLAVHIGQEGVANLNAVDVAEAGASIEHHYGYGEAAFVGQTVQNMPHDYSYSSEEQRFVQTAEAWRQADRVKLFGEVIDRLLAAEVGGFYMVPTFVAYEKQRDPARMQRLNWFDEFAPPGLAQHWWPNPERHSSVFFESTSTKEALYDQMFRVWFDFVNEYKNRGGLVTVGSDPFGGWYSLAGFYTVRELELLQHVGMHPLEVIRAATWHGARALGMNDRGLVRQGYVADLLLLRENPLRDLKAFYPTGIERWDRITGKKSVTQGIKYTIKSDVVHDTAVVVEGIKAQVRNDKNHYPAPPA